ncbi:MAG TPA: DinB family protein [Gemmatimonadales bacterium]|nr:DinB family protein [Gemmatimonadales bacterium]
MAQIDSIRAAIARLLDWEDAHGGFDKIVAGLPPQLQGKVPPGLPYSPWQLLEHLRLAQQDILEFCRNPDYEELQWPDDYWPKEAAPPSSAAWEKSVSAFRQDREALKQMALDPTLDLSARVPAGNGQTYLRELLLVADHTAYHLGQMVVVRRALGAWPGA